MLDKVKEKQAKMQFFSTLIKDKTGEINALNKEIASLRKKNGQALKADIDIRIYEINAKLSADKRFIEKCKEKRKKLREESGEILREAFISERDFRKKVEIEELFAEIYEKKARLFIDTDEGYKAVFEVSTDKKKLHGKVAEVLKAGIKTDTGRIVCLPEVEVYKFSPEDVGSISAIDGVEPKPIEKKGFWQKISGYFKRQINNLKSK